MDLRVRPEYSVEFNDNVASTLTYITEYAEVQKNYPILFRKDPESGDYQSLALFGFIKDENLFLSDENSVFQAAPGWSANYIPAMIARGPFSIAYQKEMESGKAVVSPMIQVDLDHPKVSNDVGEKVFLEHGGNSQYLENVSAVLNKLRDGIALEKPMFNAFKQFELIETVTVDIDLINNAKHQISGFYTIDAEKLQALKGNELSELSKLGFLQAAYFAVASLSNLKKLIEIKNRRLSLL